MYVPNKTKLNVTKLTAKRVCVCGVVGFQHHHHRRQLEKIEHNKIICR